jgi:transcription attenuation protein (tryptophan RNA-binding attenuator protein)
VEGRAGGEKCRQRAHEGRPEYHAKTREKSQEEFTSEGKRGTSPAFCASSFTLWAGAAHYSSAPSVVRYVKKELPACLPKIDGTKGVGGVCGMEHLHDADYVVVKALEDGVTIIGLTRGKDTRFHHTEKLDAGEVMIAQFTEHTSAIKVRGKAEIWTKHGLVTSGS